MGVYSNNKYLLFIDRITLGRIEKESDPNTLMLLHCEGENDSTTIIDEKGHTMIAGGGVNISTAVARFGASSLYFDSTDDYVYPSYQDIAFGSGEFTVDMWFYRTASTGLVFSYGGSNFGFVVNCSSSSTVLYANGNRITGSAVSGNEWHHLAIIGNGGASGSRNIKMYIDGSLIGTWTTDYDYSKNVYIGANEVATSECMAGYIDEVRISNVQRWTENFTPPTSAYPI